MQTLTQALLTALSCCTATLLAAAPAAATEFNRHIYIGGGLGASVLKPHENASGWHTVDETDTGFKLYAGYQFAPRWFAELDYTDMGAAGVAPRNSALGAPQHISYRSPALTAGYYLWDHDSRDHDSQHHEQPWNVFIRAGLAGIINNNSGNTDIYEQNTSVQITLGLGVQWRFNKHLFIRAEATSFDVDAQTYLLGVGWTFD